MQPHTLCMDVGFCWTWNYFSDYCIVWTFWLERSKGLESMQFMRQQLLATNKPRHLKLHVNMAECVTSYSVACIFAATMHATIKSLSQLSALPTRYLSFCCQPDLAGLWIRPLNFKKAIHPNNEPFYAINSREFRRGSFTIILNLCLPISDK